MKGVGLIALVAAAMASACSDLVSPSSARLPVVSRDEQDCCAVPLTDDQKQQVQNAITGLQLSSIAICSNAGFFLQDRLNSGEIQYDWATSAYGYMNTNGDPNVYLGQIAFDPGELRNTLAHEESHFMGYEDSGPPETAYDVGDECAW